MRFNYPTPKIEQEILIGETNIDKNLAQRLVNLTNALRKLKDHDIEEAASTRLLVYAATLIKNGFEPVEACRAALVEPLSDDIDTVNALMEVVLATFGK
jgi:nitric oxide reductase NorQ protein